MAYHEQYNMIILVLAECVLCPLELLRNESSTILGLFFFRVTYFSPRMGCPMVPWGFHEHITINTEWIKLEKTHLPSPLKHVRRKNYPSVDGGPW
jgi:hypothetical protein